MRTVTFPRLPPSRRHLCPFGQPCILRQDVAHTLCCCKDVQCPCHSAQRYTVRRAFPVRLVEKVTP